MRKPGKTMLTVLVLLIVIFAFGCSKPENTNDTGNTDKTVKAYAKSDIEMVPIETELDGAHNGMYVVTIDGKKYRYRMSSKRIDDVTVSEKIYSWEKKGNIYDFYEVKEYPDHVYIRCSEHRDGTDGTDYIIEYAPSEGLPEGALEEIINDGFVVMKNGHVIEGEDKWLEFVEKTGAGTSAEIKIAHYFVISGKMAKNLYELTKMDYPNAYLHLLKYDGNNYTLSPIKKENGEYVIRPDDEYDRAETFKYMKHYTEEAPSATALYTTFDKYVLVDDDAITWDDIWNSTISSSHEARLKFAEVFNKYEYKEGVDPYELTLVDIDFQ